MEECPKEDWNEPQNKCKSHHPEVERAGSIGALGFWVPAIDLIIGEALDTKNAENHSQLMEKVIPQLFLSQSVVRESYDLFDANSPQITRNVPTISGQNRLNTDELGSVRK